MYLHVTASDIAKCVLRGTLSCHGDEVSGGIPEPFPRPLVTFPACNSKLVPQRDSISNVMMPAKVGFGVNN